MTKHAKKPQGQGGTKEELKLQSILEELTFQLFQVALARRRVEDIMQENDLAMATSWRELSFVHIVLSDVHGLLRSVRCAASAEAEMFHVEHEGSSSGPDSETSPPSP